MEISCGLRRRQKSALTRLSCSRAEDKMRSRLGEGERGQRRLSDLIPCSRARFPGVRRLSPAKFHQITEQVLKIEL